MQNCVEKKFPRLLQKKKFTPVVDMILNSNNDDA